MSTADYDAGFFETISRLLREHDTDFDANRREDVRHDFSCSQLVAAFDGKNAPRGEQLQLVRCRDLSPNGFSYFTAVPPTTALVLVGLGQLPFQYFVAEVVRVDRAESPDAAYCVGCRFLRRWSA